MRQIGQNRPSLHPIKFNYNSPMMMRVTLTSGGAGPNGVYTACGRRELWRCDRHPLSHSSAEKYFHQLLNVLSLLSVTTHTVNVVPLPASSRYRHYRRTENMEFDAKGQLSTKRYPSFREQSCTSWFSIHICETGKVACFRSLTFTLSPCLP